ncbi:hypothetical protein [Collimonas pratensis]|uniref:Acetyltransferase domain protein n=1 Tax=Collimonas pratensis TaxID=279113 RepID=A0ABN4MFJ5_9BURK|nr:hypothetical protein [Collimonas pratensis]AMP16671.1 hypothetical protein CPter291_4445 [Collimonas pratensis]
MSFIPDSYSPPRFFQSDSFSLEVLSPKFAAQDFASVTASADAIRHVFGPANGWPDPQMSFAENLADLERHEREFLDHQAFAYSILSHDQEAYLGCLYIKPIKSRIENDLRKTAYGAQAFFWLDSQETEGNFSAQVLAELQMWLKNAWPFSATVFPGRTIGWPEWEHMATGSHCL